LLAVLAGAGICVALLLAWDKLSGVAAHIGAMLAAIVLVGCCYLYPIFGYLTRSAEPAPMRALILRRMLLAALISSIPLLFTWGSVEMVSGWAPKLGEDVVNNKDHTEESVTCWIESTQLASVVGAVAGTISDA